NLPKKTATFILDEENLTLINIGATPAIKHIKKSLIQINSLLSRVKFIIISDLQLDSMGGVGVLLRSCPNAQVIAPKEFIPSLVNPKFLISATRAVYGEHFTDNFEPIKPIDKQVIRGVRNKEVIELGKRSLQFLIDSMGGVGVLLRSCPNAQVIAPKEFIPSLVNPKFLISATRAVYGEHFTDNFEPIKPIDKQVIRGVRNKEVIELGKRSLQFL